MANELPIDPETPTEEPAAILAPAPEVSPQGQAAAPLPDATPLAQSVARLPMPTIPPMPQSPLQSGDPKARFMALAALGFALGQGPKSGTGMGALQGVLQANQAKHQEDLDRWKFAATQAEKQQQATQQQQAILDRQHEARIQTTYANLSKDLEKATDEEWYRKTIGLYAGGLQAAGYRTTPVALMQQFPYSPPSDEQEIQKAVDKYFKNPMVAALPPEQKFAGAISYKRNGQTVQLPITEALKRIGMDVPTTDANGNSLFSDLGKGPIADQAMKMAENELRTQGIVKDPKNPKAYNDALSKRAGAIVEEINRTDVGQPVKINKGGKPVYVRPADAIGQQPWEEPKPSPETARLDKSYELHTKRLDTLEKPLADQAERIGRLRATVNQMTPQADALIAPELLTAMAGGAGSGLRMNEAEISRIVGGRNNWQSLKARLEAWQTNPDKPFSVTPEQRKQMRSLVSAIADRGQKRLAIIDDARSKLIDAKDVNDHRRIVNDVGRQLNTESVGTDQSPDDGISVQRGRGGP